MERVREKKGGLGLSEMLEGMPLDGLKDLCRLCFGPRAPGISRCVLRKTAMAISFVHIATILEVVALSLA